MNQSGVCAVIITFRPQISVLDNLAKLRSQVGGLVVVDNGSSAESLAPLRAATHEMNFTLVENGVNLGIAAALNVGVQWAKAQGYEGVALFDQDSTVTGGFIHTMLGHYNGHSHRHDLAIVAPVYKSMVTGRTEYPHVARDGEPVVVMTSGSLMPMKIFEKCGWFEEDLFIDQVDHEYCLRVRSQGHRITLCDRAVLIHEAGAPRPYKVVLSRRIETGSYSAKRRYYINRNTTVMILRYWLTAPAWSLRAWSQMIKNIAKVLLVGDAKWQTVRFVSLGVFDGLRGRMGKTIEL